MSDKTYYLILLLILNLTSCAYDVMPEVSKETEIIFRGCYFPPETSGYRVQIYYGTSREEALEAKQKSYELYPRVTPYLSYRRPNYRVAVGDFLEEDDCVKIYNTFQKNFKTVEIISSIIKTLDTEHDNR